MLKHNKKFSFKQIFALFVIFAFCSLSICICFFQGNSSVDIVYAGTGSTQSIRYLPVKNARCYNNSSTDPRYGTYYYDENISLNFLSGGINGFQYIYTPQNNTNANDIYSNTVNLQNLYSGYSTSLRFASPINSTFHSFIIEDAWYSAFAFNYLFDATSALLWSSDYYVFGANLNMSYYVVSPSLEQLPNAQTFNSSISVDSLTPYLYWEDFLDEFQRLEQEDYLYIEWLSIDFYNLSDYRNRVILQTTWDNLIDYNEFYNNWSLYAIDLSVSPIKMITDSISNIFDIELFGGFKLSTFFYIICGATILGLGFKIIFGG